MTLMAGEAVASEGTLAREAIAARRPGTFHSLRYRDYRLLWQGQIGASASQWMEQIARPLLILELTDSALMVGLLQATRMVPQLLLGIWAGVMADRMDKRRILLISQTITFLTHAVTAALILSGAIEPWMVFVTTFIAGSSMALNQPARQSLIPHMVPDESLANAVALNSAAVNTMRIGGPSIAGLILVFFDIGDLYLFQALVYVWVISSTFQIGIRTRGDKKQTTSMLTELFDGFRAVNQDRVIFYILVLCLAMFIWGMPYQGVFVPLIARDGLGLDRSGLGLLVSTIGIGALLGSLWIATVGDTIGRRGWIMLGQLVIFSLSLLLLARAESLLLAVPALIMSGAMQTSFMSLNNAYVLGRTPRELQGRIMSLFSLDRGLVPLGAALGGVLAETLGPQQGLAIMAAVFLAMTLLLALAVPSLRRIS
jgi:MFS transporter, DHA1 family, staphyloferrin A biosynthesis exporter